MNIWELLARLIDTLGRPSRAAGDAALLVLTRRLGCAAVIVAAGVLVGAVASAVAVAGLWP